MGSTRNPHLKPAVLWRLATDAVTGRISIPLATLRTRAAEVSDKIALELEPASPGLRIRGQAHALGALVSFSARIDAEGVHVHDNQRTVRLTVSDVALSTPDDAVGPLAEAVRDGMIDTANPATLVGNMIALPDFVVSAEGQTIVIDLMRIPTVGKDDMLRAAIAAATSYLCVKEIHVGDDSIDLQLGVLLGGPKEAVLCTARALLTPAVRYLWPEGERS